MALFFHLVLESVRFAWNSIRANLLRTSLSLLGVTIGIFAIISILTAVDSIKGSVNDRLRFLRLDVMDIRRFPYSFDTNLPWWEYFRRPQVTHEEFKFLEDNVQNCEDMVFFAGKGGVTSMHKSNSSGGNFLAGVSYDYLRVYDVAIAEGRYFSSLEVHLGTNLAIVGHRVAKDLFPTGSALGRNIKVKGLKYRVIGVFKEEGASIFGESPLDRILLVPFPSFEKMYFVGPDSNIDSRISAKGLPDDPNLNKLESELQGLLRAKRGLRPSEDSNFATNRQESLINQLGGIFVILDLAGWVIGAFSLLIGGFGIANIMFVSVRERTPIIGIQKSLGAKNFFILFQFLFESIFLCLIGGLIGLGLVSLAILVLNTGFDLGAFTLSLSSKNAFVAITVSAVIGVIAGIFPALRAARMDPVEAIRAT